MWALLRTQPCPVYQEAGKGGRDRREDADSNLDKGRRLGTRQEVWRGSRREGRDQEGW